MLSHVCEATISLCDAMRAAQPATPLAKRTLDAHARRHTSANFPMHAHRRPKIAATTPMNPDAPVMYTELAALEGVEDELEPEPELVPGARVPVPDGLDSPPEQT